MGEGNGEKDSCYIIISVFLCLVVLCIMMRQVSVNLALHIKVIFSVNWITNTTPKPQLL